MTDSEPKKPKPKPPKKPAKAGLIGPLYVWELLRLARRGQDNRARLILALSLFFILTAFGLIWFSGTNAYQLFFGAAEALSIKEVASFGEWFSVTFVMGQLAVLCLLTPAYAAGGIAEEKDKKTLPFLLVSELTDREIVLGKFFGRTTFLLGILFAGLPILAITQLHGGVTLEFLVYSYAITAATVILLSAVSAWGAAQAETYRGGLFRGYGLSALIALGGCGVPWVNPFLVLWYLKGWEVTDLGTFHTVGIGYPIILVVMAVFGVLFAKSAIGKLRTKASRATPKPPPWVRERYRDEDRDKAWEEERKRKRDERIAVEVAERRRLAELYRDAVVLDDSNFVPEPLAEASDGEPKRLKAKRVIVAATPLPNLPKANSTAPPPEDQPPERKRRWDTHKRKKRKGYRDPETHASKFASPKPAIAEGDPFYWKERYTSGSVRTEDDEMMKSIGYTTGGVVAVVVLLVLGFVFLAMLNSNDGGRGLAKWMLLMLGSTGAFAQLMQVGFAACGMVGRERQRLTLESLLTIPVERRDILWPKWIASATKGLWWGIPSLGLIGLAFLVGSVPVLVLPMAVYLAALVPLAASYGLWLSIRCSNANKAILWFLPVLGTLILLPLLAGGTASPSSWLVWSLSAFAFGTMAIAATWWFWRRSARAFELETILENAPR